MARKTARPMPRGDAGAVQRHIRRLRILHPFPSLLVAMLTVALAVLAAPHASRVLLVRLGLGMLFFQFSIGVANDVVDAEADRVAKPWKPVPSGLMPRRAAILLSAGFAGAGLLVTSSLSIPAWLIGAAGLFCGLSYDAYLKRTPLSWLPLAIALPLIPSWVFVALDRWNDLLWWVHPLGIILGLALHLANQAPDVNADRNAGAHGAAQRLGSRASAAISIALFGLAASAAVVVLLFESPARALLAAVDGATVVVLAPRAPVFFGRDGLFGLLATASAILAIVFLSAV